MHEHCAIELHQIFELCIPIITMNIYSTIVILPHKLYCTYTPHLIKLPLVHQ